MQSPDTPTADPNAPASGPRIILASQSPRRAELLQRIGASFSVRPADIDETYLTEEPPRDYAERLAREKASIIAGSDPDAYVIGSDTVVVLDGEVLGKPADEPEAVGMLNLLSGRQHTVMTAVAIAHAGEIVSGVEEVQVRFRSLTREECVEYAATQEPLDKAGSYGIQGFGSTIVEWIEGDYFAVMGLPIVRLLGLFRELGWRYAYSDGFVRVHSGSIS